MYGQRENCFDRAVKKSYIATAVFILTLFGGVALILCGTVFFRSPFGGSTMPNLGFMMPGIFITFISVAGFFGSFAARSQARIAYDKLKVLLSEEEIAQIERVAFVNTAVLRKMQRLQEEGMRKGDMREYDNFCQMAMMSGFSGMTMAGSILRMQNVNMQNKNPWDR
jgi:hypothetical protein